MPSTILGSIPDFPDEERDFPHEFDKGTWERFSALVNLPVKSRFALAQLIRMARAKLNRTDGMTPSEVRKKFETASNLAKRLSSEIKALNKDGTAKVAMTLASNPVSESGIVWAIDFDKFYANKIQEIDDLQGLLSASLEHIQKRKRGPDDTFRSLVADLDQLLIEHTGQGLSRTVEISALDTESRPATRSARCLTFVREIASLLNTSVTDANIDDAIKEAISKRNRGGRSMG